MHFEGLGTHLDSMTIFGSYVNMIAPPVCATLHLGVLVEHGQGLHPNMVILEMTNSSTSSLYTQY